MKGRNGTLSVLLTMLVLLCIVGVVAGEGFYKWVPEEYSEPFVIDKAMFRTLEMTAFQNREVFLTEKLIQMSCTPHMSRDSLVVSVGTKCQPTWDYYVGKGKFSVSDRELRAAYMEAGSEIMTVVEKYFPGIDKARVVVVFFVRGAPVGVWHNGVMKLEGE